MILNSFWPQHISEGAQIHGSLRTRVGAELIEVQWWKTGSRYRQQQIIVSCTTWCWRSCDFAVANLVRLFSRGISYSTQTSRYIYCSIKNCPDKILYNFHFRINISVKRIHRHDQTSKWNSNVCASLGEMKRKNRHIYSSTRMSTDIIDLLYLYYVTVYPYEIIYCIWKRQPWIICGGYRY